MAEYDAIVLVGGTSARMGGGDKTRLMLAGISVLDRVLRTVAGAGRIVCVGDERPALTSGLVWTREDPPGGGPAAAVMAGLACTSADVVALIAGDMPLLAPDTVAQLVSTARTAAAVTGVIAVDGAGREQWLCSAWRREALLRADLVPGGSLHRALHPLAPTRLDLADGGLDDVDTEQDLRAVADRLGC